MKTAVYMIRCLTNLHVGVGGANYNVVDNPVQRDVTDRRPCIYSSSLKGALRQFFTSLQPDTIDIDYIFGPDNDGAAEKDNKTGHFNFLQANLLAFPIQASVKEDIPEGYKLCSCLAWKESLKELGQYMGVAGIAFPEFAEEEQGVLTDAHKSLPIIARNYLKNGESKNLWYEEVVPAESRFVFFVTYPENTGNENSEDKKPEDIFKKFNEFLTNEKSVVQIGANSSVGYGLCKISNITQS
ncbi:type III-B CRISPR module RAMP protein Cmr4 [Bacteroides heparinolyticus]|uniref:type III-B CRISPR module RAMP protein Cmr4 n=1 Tax=Prevotella heparinolytica TaxID=28113 RepID=UPI0035A04777